MKTNATVRTSITNNLSVDINTVLNAEWQMNRFYRTAVDNTPTEDSEGYDIEYFPIESITKANRPKAGIVKAIVGQAFVDSEYHDAVPPARYYTISEEDKYKYWQSPYSAAAGTFLLTTCKPQVIYVEENQVSGVDVPRTVNANKIYFTIENTYAYPTEIDVQIKTTTGGAWTTVASEVNFTIGTGGKVELWYTGSSWTSTKNLANSTTISAVRLLVNKMNKEAYFNLIELGVALELDLTSDLVSWNDTFSMGEVDFITPLGQISSNSGGVELFNETGKYSNSNESSILYNLLDKGVIFRCWTKYGSQLVQEFEMFSDVWQETDASTSITLVDGSKFFMDEKPGAVMYTHIPVQEAIWRICDIIGFNNYQVTSIDSTPHSIIDIFWTDEEKTAWEIFGELSRATQTAIYFDSFGVLQIKTRGVAWNDARTPDYDFIRDSVPGGQPSNIVSLSEDSQFEANRVAINWQPTGFSERVDNVVPFEVVWEPEGSVVLRATELGQNFLIGDMTLNMPVKEGSTWPWNGFANIEGEFIEFDAKRYIYYNASGVRTAVWVDDYATQKRFDETTPASKLHLNHYTGVLRVKERGLWNTEEKNHRIDMNGWTRRRQRNYGASNSPCSGIQLHSDKSLVRVSGPKGLDMDDYTYLTHGAAVDQGYYYLGTSMRIDKSAHRDKCGGIFFHAGDGVGTGYFLEIMATVRMGAKMRHNRNEVIFYSMKADGTKKRYGGQEVVIKDKSKTNTNGATTKVDVGARMAVVQDKFIDFDIWFEVLGNGDHRLQFWANGNYLFESIVPSGSGWQHTRSGLVGLYARGQSSLSFDYFYGINNLGVDPIDAEPYFDRIDGAYRGDQALGDWDYERRKVRRKIRKKWTKAMVKYNQRFMEEFGPVVHEMREFDIKFTSNTPVLESKLYYSNETQAMCSEFTGSIKGARFVMTNKHRENAIISGDDERTSMGNGTINHKLFVYGRPVIQKDSHQIVKTDEWAQRRRGVIDIEYNSPWIQNEQEANRFAAWLTTHWSRSDTTLNIEVFGNPLIELADVVNVTYRHIDSSFYVIAINNTWDNGLQTQLTLRKVSTALV